MLQILQDAMRRILGGHSILPPTTDLLDIFETRRPPEQKVDAIVPIQRTPQLQPAKQFPPRQRRPVEMEDTSKPESEVKLSVTPSLWKDRTPGQDMQQVLRLQQSPKPPQFPQFQQSQKLQQPIPLQQPHQLQQAGQYVRRKQIPIEMEDTSIPNRDSQRVCHDQRERGMWVLSKPFQNFTNKPGFSKVQIQTTSRLCESRSRQSRMRAWCY